MRKPTFPLNKGCGIVPFRSQGLVESFSMSLYLFICFDWFVCLSSLHQNVPHFSFARMLCGMSTGTSCSHSHNCGCFFPPRLSWWGNPPFPLHNLTSSWQLYHSSLAGLSSRDVMAGRPIPVALWDAVRLATVCRRTRTSRQSLSRLLHSLQAAEELREVRCWHGGWVLFKVALERLSTFKSHRTSQHSASGSTPEG